MDSNAVAVPVTEKSDASRVTAGSDARRGASRTSSLLARLEKRIKACGETLELCVDELEESRIGLSSDVFKTWRAVDKHLSQLIADLEASELRS